MEICPKDVKEQILLRLDEVGENYENLKVKVRSKIPQLRNDGTLREGLQDER